jgi:hypothetical protein
LALLLDERVFAPLKQQMILQDGYFR